LLEQAHDIDSTRFQLDWTRKGIDAVRHANSVFHDFLKLVPWTTFGKLADADGTDAAARSFKTRHRFVSLLFAQFCCASLAARRRIGDVEHPARLYHVGAKAPKRSTFAGANRNRDPEVFSRLFEPMPNASTRGFRRTMRDAVRLIDKTSLHLAGVGAQWAESAHVVHDPDLGRPVTHAATAANVDDIAAAKQMPVEACATSVFDLAIPRLIEEPGEISCVFRLGGFCCAHDSVWLPQ